MLRPFSRFFPGDEKEEDNTEELEFMSPAFTIQFIQGSKVYSNANEKKAVWRLDKVIEKLRHSRDNGDPMLNNAQLKMAEMQENLKGDEMTHKWFEDCVKVWQKAHDQVLAEEPGKPYEEPPLTNEEVHEELTGEPPPPKEEKKKNPFGSTKKKPPKLSGGKKSDE